MYSKEHARASILGAFIGDSCGSYCEFSRVEVDDETMMKCMQMPGGGPFRLNPGQVTDDSELAMCLMEGLCEMEPGKMDIEKVCHYYRKWICSSPFDIGNNTRQTLGSLGTSDKMKAVAYGQFKSWLSNGSLMRVTPLAVWAADCDDPVLHRELIKADTELSHGNDLVHDACFVYSATIGFLIKNAEDKDRFALALEYANMLATKYCSAKEQDQTVADYLKHAAALDEQKLEVKEVLRTLNVREKIGWLRHGFIMAFYFLHQLANNDRDCDFATAIKESIRQGGDTDTNACIVGGLIGAAVGKDGIPNDMAQKVLTFDCASAQTKKRASFLSVG